MIDKKYLIDPEHLDEYLKHFPNYEQEMQKDLVDKTFWKGKRVFITGITGFVGGHLVEKLLELECNVYGLIRRHSVPDYPNLAKTLNQIQLVEGNLTDINSIIAAFNLTQPEVVFHLGAQSFVPTSFRAPIETYETNIIGTANVLEASRQTRANIQAIHIACSSEEYGLVYPNEVPIKETNPLRPQSPYAVSKVAGELIAQCHYKAFGTPVVLTRTFNHEGPRRGLQFVTSVVARQIARAKLRKTKTVTIGNPNPIRDFSDVRDIIQGYLLAVEKAKRGEPYNLGHGFGITIENLVKLAAKACDVEVEIAIDKSRYRPAEVDILLCDFEKAKNELGFKPRIPLNKSMQDNVEYFMNNPHLLDIERH
ncbi:MAG: GDP-mannose 4,6-dehydratase [bacterium]|nr:GDP-mannose 4,6-dehydratase [bacterium]